VAAGVSVRELAEQTGVSVRTIRYYQAEGLLEAPVRRGRAVRYHDAHRLRLLAITRLQERGLRLAAIREILRDGDAGDDDEALAGWTGLGDSLARPWSDDRPILLGEDELAERLAGLPADTCAGLLRAGVVEKRTDTTPVVFLVPSPGLLQVATASIRLGVPVEAGARIQRFLQERVRATAVDLVDLFTDEVSLGHLSAEGPAALADLLDQLRPLARRTFDLLFTHEMERAQRALLDRAAETDDTDEPRPGGPTP
jgi:DNA-binding transcriptional MerR regulator